MDVIYVDMYECTNTYMIIRETDLLLGIFLVDKTCPGLTNINGNDQKVSRHIFFRIDDKATITLPEVILPFPSSPTKAV